MDNASGVIRKPVIEHVRELRVRLTWSVLAVGLFSGVAYWLHPHLLFLLQKPLGETLYYSSPTGGFTFLFKLVVTAGFITAIPVILYNIYRFIEPTLKKHHTKGMYKYIAWSVVLAYGGALFAYFVSLPAALHFLAGFATGEIKALISANDYFNFAIAYIAGFACLFELPLVLLFINRIKPLKPSGMMKFQRYIILGSFIVAAILTPTPDPFNQLMMAGPMILLYQIGLILVILANRKHVPQEAKIEPPIELPIRSQRLVGNDII